MSLGLCLGLLTLYYTWRNTSAALQKDTLKTAAIIGSLYSTTVSLNNLMPQNSVQHSQVYLGVHDMSNEAMLTTDLLGNQRMVLPWNLCD